MLLFQPLDWPVYALRSVARWKILWSHLQTLTLNSFLCSKWRYPPIRYLNRDFLSGISQNASLSLPSVRYFSTLLEQSQILTKSLAIFYYDWLDSLPLEISEIWAQKFSLTKLLYLSTRYIIFVSWILQSIVTFALNPPQHILPSENTNLSSVIIFHAYHLTGILIS